MKKPTTLVLGAGASADYHFPVGQRLRKDILDLGEARLAKACGPAHFASAARSFLQEFRLSQRYSIDAFLARRGEFTEIGKVAIAEVLLSREPLSEVRMFDEHEGSHWYRRLLNALVQDDWSDFDPSWLSIVTFNYDRSLEWFLLRTLMANYRKSQTEVAERLNRLRIVHVYGSLGAPWAADDHLPYSIYERQPADRVWAARTAAERLVVIPEGRDDDPRLEPAREAMRSAAVVAFLGFGFDADNVRRLGAPMVFGRNLSCVPVLATTYQMEEAEVGHARRLLFGGLRAGEPEQRISPDFRTFNVDCDMLLRKSGLLN